MENWSGRYKALMGEICKNSHLGERSLFKKAVEVDGVNLTPFEWQVLDYICENDDDKMTDISDRLGVIQSSFSRCTKILLESGLIEAYHTVNNKKNKILKPTEKGIAVHQQISHRLAEESSWKDFFEELDQLPDDQLAVVTRAFEKLNRGMPAAIEEKKLIKIE